MRMIKIDALLSVILRFALVYGIPVTVQLDMATPRRSPPSIHSNVKMLVYRGPVQCRRKDKMDTTIKDLFDPVACVTPLMIRGTDLQILERDLSILNNRLVPGHEDWRSRASREWRLESLTFASSLAAPVRITSG